LKKSLLFTVLFLFPILLFSQNSKQQIAVLALDPVGVSKSESITLTNRLRSEMVKTGAFTILERDKMDVILKEQGFQMTGCTSSECAVEAGQLLNVKQICSGSIGKIGSIYTVTVRLVDVETGKILKNVTEDCECPLELVLTNSMHNIALKIAGKMPNTGGVRSLEKGTGDIFIKTEPPGAEIYFDGVKMDETTPITLRNVAAGEHKIEMVKGNLVGSLKIRIKDNELYRQEIKLEKARGSLKIFSDPPEAQITLNGNNYGETPTFLDRIGGGKYRLKVAKTGYMPYEEDVRILPGEVKRIDVSLQKMALLSVSSSPAGADIFINGEKRGKSPVMIYVAPNRSLDVKIGKNGYEEKHINLNLEQGAYKKLEIQLDESRGFVIFDIKPKNAEINIDGRNYKGSTAISLTSGGHNAAISRSGYLSKKLDFNVRYNQRKKISVHLQPKTLSGALKRSFVPGWGQFYQEKTTRGWLYPLLFAGCAAGSYLYYEQYNDDLDVYNQAVENYRNAFDEDEIIYYRQQMDDAYDTALSTKNIRNAFYISTALIYLWNMADVYLLPPAWERNVKLSVKTDGRFYGAGNMSLQISVFWK
jgi:TolB-like protein